MPRSSKNIATSSMVRYSTFSCPSSSSSGRTPTLPSSRYKCSLRSRSLTPRASTSPHQLKRDLAQTARLCKVSVRNPG
jgi:hypothetical protein